MRFRLGVMVGFGTGYYLGAKAGRERYEQLHAMVAKVKRSDAYDAASDKAKAVVDLGVERAKDLVEEHTPLGANGHTSPNIVGT
jgi:hypothetical protein